MTTFLLTFFPQLIAGPIVHHAELIPQLKRPCFPDASFAALNLGVTIFAVGLFKKVIVADSLASYASSVFDGVSNGAMPSGAVAWLATLAYTFQIYFDFSGYSDMAIGLGRMMGFDLPINFRSPYKSRNIIEFWRNWHMTLSRFLRDYLYIRLGGTDAEGESVMSTSF